MVSRKPLIPRNPTTEEPLPTTRTQSPPEATRPSSPVVTTARNTRVCRRQAPKAPVFFWSRCNLTPLARSNLRVPISASLSLRDSRRNLIAIHPGSAPAPLASSAPALSRRVSSRVSSHFFALGSPHGVTGGFSPRWRPLAHGVAHASRRVSLGFRPRFVPGVSGRAPHPGSVPGGSNRNVCEPAGAQANWPEPRATSPASPSGGICRTRSGRA